MKKDISKIIFGAIGVFVFVVLFVCISNLVILFISRMVIYQGEERFDNVPNVQTALVLGARVWRDGSMSEIFKDRAKVALELYRKGKVKKILVSGDHGRAEYDEVNAAKDYFLSEGVADRDIFLDHAGFDTYDSLYRARDVFEAESLIICTQDFHLPRAVFIGKSLGLEVYGISTDLQSYIGETRRNIREVGARAKAMVNIILHSKPKFLGPVIPLSGESFASWD